MLNKLNLYYRNCLSFNFSSTFLILTLALSSVFIYFLVFEKIIPFVMPDNFQQVMDLDYGDGPGYLNFDFSSLKIILSQHRSFGLPLIIEFYKIFDENFVYWPKFNFFLFTLSILFIFISLNKYEFSKFFAFFFSFSILFSYNLYLFFFFWTEIFSITFLNFSIGLFFLSLRKKKIFYFCIFSFFLFYTYQIRPSFLIFIIFPIIFVLSKSILLKKNYFIFSTTIFSIGPIFLFLVIKFFITGYFSFVPFSGSQMAGHAMFYLNKDNLEKISSQNYDFAKSLINRKEKISYPCNLDKKNAIKNGINPTKNRYECWNYYFISSWLQKIKNHKKIEPFNDEKFNHEPWLHTKSLEIFFIKSGDNNKIDKELATFALEVYKLNLANQFKWIFESTTAGLSIYIPRLKYLFYLFGAIFTFYLINNYLINKKIKLNFNNSEIIFFICIFFCQLANFLIFSIIHVPDQRTMSIQFYLTIPTILSLITSNLRAKN
jgi:hypothetical protein